MDNLINSMGKILVADDAPPNRKLVKDFLNFMLKSDHEIVEAGNGGEALAIIKGENLSAAILDQEMPQLDGSEVIDAAREDEQLNFPYAIFTGNEAKATNLKNSGYVVFKKPVEIKEMIEYIKSRLL